ncbi:MAG: fatty acid desaturase, partial [Blastocatellia bacterium]
MSVAVPSSSVLSIIWRHSTSDALFIGLAVAHGALLLAMPSAALIAIGLWWNANTISHNFIHRPFFRVRALNTIFSWYLTLLLGFPQTLWRERHLAHHAGRPERRQFQIPMAIELGWVLALWSTLLIIAPTFTLTVYLPGYLLGLGLCYLQGHYEHARGTVSHHGRLYNLLFFNDGYHVEHHERPGEDWRRLPKRIVAGASISQWPAVFRWIESLNLCLLERLVLRSAFLQRFVLEKHERAIARLLPALPTVRSVGIVGGGLFPRTAVILNRLLPEARLILIDMSEENLRIARAFLEADVEFVNDCFDSASRYDPDLLVIPLAFVGDRAAIYRHPPAPV